MTLERVVLCPSCTRCLPGYHLPYFAAVATGLFADRGLDVEIVSPGSSLADNVRAVASEHYDCCLNNVHRFLEVKGADPTLEAKYAFMVVRCSHLAAFAIEGRASSNGRPIQSFEDISGASFLHTPGFAYHAEYFRLLEHLGIEGGPIVEAPYPGADALASGAGDVTVNWLDLLPDFQSAARRAHAEVRVLPFFQARGYDVYGSGIIAGPRLLKRRPQTLLRFIAAVKEALIQTRRDPEGALEAARDQFAGIASDRVTGGWKAVESLIFSEPSGLTGAMSRQMWKSTIRHHTAAYGGAPIPPESAFDNGLLQQNGGQGRSRRGLPHHVQVVSS